MRRQPKQKRSKPQDAHPQPGTNKLGRFHPPILKIASRKSASPRMLPFDEFLLFMHHRFRKRNGLPDAMKLTQSALRTQLSFHGTSRNELPIALGTDLLHTDVILHSYFGVGASLSPFLLLVKPEGHSGLRND